MVTYQLDTSSGSSYSMPWSGLLLGDDIMLGKGGGEKYSGDGGLFGGEHTSKYGGLRFKDKSSGHKDLSCSGILSPPLTQLLDISSDS